MNPYESYTCELLLNGELEKSAFVGPALMGLNQLVGAPGMGSMAGGAMKWVGGIGHAAGSKPTNWLHRAGASVERHSDAAQHAINDMLNKGPGVEYSLKDHLPDVVRKPLGFIGMETEKKQTMTPLRAAVWAGGALSAADTAKNLTGIGKKPDDVAKAAALEAEEDLAALVRYMEDRR